MLKIANKCKFRDKAESACEKNGCFCPAYTTQDDMPCGGCCYSEEDEEEENDA